LASTPLRRPLPALIALLALLLLTAIVWWRVLHRDSGAATTSSSCSTQSPVHTLPGPARVTLQVLNATHRAGIARKARNTLLSDGFNVPAVASNDKSKVKILGVAEIRFGPSGRSAAQLVHYYLPGARMVAKQTKGATVVISLGEKYRGLVSPSSVQALLDRKQIRVDTTAPGAPSPSPSC
jgi:hypothetical protein